MALAERLPPGPIKRWDRYFTIPIDSTIYANLETMKWRCDLDKTEILRRFMEYLTALPPDAQDKILKSFDGVREHEKEKLKAERIQKRAAKKRKPLNWVEEVKADSVQKPVVRIIKRSGLP